MLQFFVYLVTGLCTALPVMYMIAGAWMGVPFIATEAFSLAGSCILVSASYIALFSRRTASKMSLSGVACICSFWLVEPIRAIVHGEGSLVLAVILSVVWTALAGTIVLACKDCWRKPEQDKYPRRRRAILYISGCLLIAFIGWVEWQHKARERTSCRYELPEGYVGWAQIEFGIPSTAATPIRQKQLIFSFPETGLLKTSSAQEFGEAKDHYYYCSEKSCRELQETGWGNGGMIWGESSGTFEEGGKPEVRREQFFVGTEAQYYKMQSLSIMKEGIVPGDLRTQLR